MKLNILKLGILVILYIGYVLATATSTTTSTYTSSLASSSASTSTKTSTETHSKMKSKTSIFSYDFLSVMKHKMKKVEERKAQLGLEKSMMINSFDPVPIQHSRRAVEPPSNNGDSTSSQSPVTPLTPPTGEASSTSSTPPAANATSSDSTSTSTSSNVNSSNFPVPKQSVGSISFTGWVKYFKYSANINKNEKPNSFFKNNEFYTESKDFPNIDLTTKSADGQYEYIPKESLWYATLFTNSLNIASSRIVSICYNSFYLAIR
jgi:hypothetical protein